MAGRLQCDQNQRQSDEPRENASHKREPAPENPLSILPGLLNETENLQRNHRQDARHQIQNEPANETEEKKRPDTARYGSS